MFFSYSDISRSSMLNHQADRSGIVLDNAVQSVLQVVIQLLQVDAMRFKAVLQAKLGRSEAEGVARAALATATAVMQAKRVEILVPPQAAAWLQVCLLLRRSTCLGVGLEGYTDLIETGNKLCLYVAT